MIFAIFFRIFIIFIFFPLWMAILCHSFMKKKQINYEYFVNLALYF